MVWARPACSNNASERSAAVAPSSRANVAAEAYVWAAPSASAPMTSHVTDSLSVGAGSSHAP